MDWTSEAPHVQMLTITMTTISMTTIAVPMIMIMNRVMRNACSESTICAADTWHGTAVQN